MALAELLREEYLVLSLDFQMLSYADFETDFRKHPVPYTNQWLDKGWLFRSNKNSIE